MVHILGFPLPINRGDGGLRFARVVRELLREFESRVTYPYNLFISVEESLEVTMSSLSVTSLFSSVSGGPSRRSLAVDVVSSEAERVEDSSHVAGPLSREHLELTMSSSLSGYEGEETREAEYMWVHEVFFVFTEVSMLQNFVDSVDIVLEGVPNGSFALRRCREFETVCLGKGKERKDFFYFYSCLTSDIHVRFPFDNFTMEVLCILNVAPSQLHPNSWTSLQAFQLLCEVLGVKATSRSFLHFFGTRPGDRIGWMSLVGQAKNSLFAPYLTSYKNFKGGFFKVVIEEEGRSFFFDGETLRFPFYWTIDPARFNVWSRSLMNDDDLKVLSILDRLPRKILTRPLVRDYLLSDKCADVDGMCFYSSQCFSYFD